MKVSFTTTCSDQADNTLRTDHLKATLTQNMRDNVVYANDKHQVEFAVLNYNSKNDALHDWIMTDPRMVEAMDSGLLRYGHNQDAPKFRMSHAKNQATRLATGDIVCNVDADNFTGPQFAKFLSESFEQNPKSFMNISRRVKREVGGGIWGRIAIGREDFATLGGYDEVAFKGWGGEDTDFVRRARGLGLHNYFIDDTRFAKVIQHSNESRADNSSSTPEEYAEQLAHIESVRNASRSIFNRIARRLSILPEAFDVMARQVQVNNGGEFGMGVVHIGKQAQPVVFGPAYVTEKYSRAHVNALNFQEFIIERLMPGMRSLHATASASDNEPHASI